MTAPGRAIMEPLFLITASERRNIHQELNVFNVESQEEILKKSYVLRHGKL